MTSIENMASEIIEAMQEYADVSTEEFLQIAKEIAKEGAKKLKIVSQKGTGKGKKGHYADGWGISVVMQSASRFEFVIHNKKKPGLTHLLENGHQLRQGGRARAFPHIADVEEWCIKEYERRTEEMLRG